MCDVPLRYYPNVYCSNIALRTSSSNHFATTTSDRPSKKDHRSANTNNFLPTTMLDFLPAIVAWHRTQNPNWLRSWDKFDRCTVMKTTIRNYLKASLHKSKRELLQQVGRHHHGRAQIFTIGWLIPLAQHVILQAPCTSTQFKQELAIPRSFRQAINSSSDCFDLRGHRPKIIKPAHDRQTHK